MNDKQIKVLTFSSLFPNSIQPNNAIFVKNRMSAVCRHCPVELKVVAPVPYFPPLKRFRKWYTFSQIPGYEIQDEVEVFHPRYLVTPKIGMTLYGLSMFLCSLALMRRIFRSWPFDVIDAHYVYPDGFAAVLLGKMFKRPVVVSARGTDINLYPKFPIIKRLIQYTLRHSDHIISVSSALKEIMLCLGVPDEKITVIPNGIDKKKFFCMDQKVCRQKVGISCKQKVLLSIAALIELKGHHILIDAIKLLASRNQLDFKTYIIGTGDWELKLHTQIKQSGLMDRVFLVGQVPNDELIYWYNAADIFFLGSSREGWPNVISEALACGTPVIATPVGDVPDIIKAQFLGHLVEREPQAIAKALVNGFKQKWNREKIWKDGQKRTWDIVAYEVLDIFKTVISKYPQKTIM